MEVLRRGAWPFVFLEGLTPVAYPAVFAGKT